MPTYDETANGGILASGLGAYGPSNERVSILAAQVVGDRKNADLFMVALETLGDLITNEGIGGGELAGSATTNFFDYIEGSGGILSAGDAELDSTSYTAEGGAEVGTAGDWYVYYLPIASGGAVIGGHAALVFEDFASGGVEIAGESFAENFIPGRGGVVGGGISPNGYSASVIGSGGSVLTGIADAVSVESVVSSFSVTFASDDGYWAATSGAFNAVDPVALVGHESTFLGSLRGFFRIRNVPIPVGSSILDAYITFRSAGASVGSPSIRLHFNAADNAVAPTSKVEADIKALTTASSGTWALGSGLVAGSTLVSPSVATALQEVIDRPGWSGGNALMVMVVPVTASGDNYALLATEENLTYASAQLTVNYTTGSLFYDSGSGSILAGGVATNLFYQRIGYGSGLLGGETVASPVERYFGDGGANVGTTGSWFVDYMPVASGGGVLAGSAVTGLTAGSYVPTGGLEAAGEAPVQSGVIASGGAEIGGAGTTNFYDIIEETLDGEGIIASGSAKLESHINYSASGQVTLGGTSPFIVDFLFVSSGLSADAPPDFAGVSVGYRNSENPTIVDFSFTFDIECGWSVDKAVTLDTDIVWNTGRLPLFFYRVVGKPKFLDQCDPLQGVGECCKLFIINVSARSVSDLCERLRKRRWKWPVKLVERFSRNAETALITEDDENCNVLTPVEICNNIVCEEFCIDYDVKEVWGFTQKTQVNAFKYHEATGSINISGSADLGLEADFDFFHVADGGVEMGGVAKSLSNFVTADGGMIAGGVAVSQSSSWYYVGGEWPYSRNLPPKATDQFVEQVSDRNWISPDSAKASDDAWAYSDTSNGVPTKYLVLKNFALGLPDDAIVVGIEAVIERHSTGSVKDNAVYLVVGEEIVSDNMASPTTWPIGTDASKVYGGLGEVWRDPDDIDYLGDWEAVDINSEDFGIAIRVEPTISQLTSESRIDSVQLKVYWEIPNQHIVVGGEARYVADSYQYVSDGGLILIAGEIPYPKIGIKFISDGRGDMGPGFGGVTMAGSYGVRLTSDSEGGVETGGAAQIGQPGVKGGGVAKIETTQNFYEATGGLTLETFTGLYRWNARYLPTGGIEMSGIAGFNNLFSVVPQGGITFGGDALWKSNSFNFKSDGNAVFIFGTADTNFSDFGTLETNIGFLVEAKDVAIKFREESTPSDVTPNDLVTACQCSDMDLIMPMTHNLDINNKFGQFLQRNNLSFSRVLGLKYSRVNDSWLFNQSYEGFGASGMNRELWTLIFQLQCTNLVGGSTLESRIWRYSMQVIQKNLTTFADYDTRMIVSFLPVNACKDGGFNVSIDVNTQSQLTLLVPDVTVYDFKLHDNISLFKNKYWLDNPNLKIQLSQTGIDDLIKRYPLYIT